MNNFVEKINKIQDFISGNSVEKEKIIEAENLLNLKFSDEYRHYLLNIGVAVADGHEFTGITPIERLNVVNVTLEERKNNPKVPLNLYVIEQANIDGIVVWQTEKGAVFQTAPNSKPIKLCNSLSEYIDL
ncbi:MAG: SMI1/KNR4 family protein [Ruminococcus sp.]|nr:SMI1/KNR4 family protein [Ruminococcus sp.]MCM1380686.1 SMI1/KNR4 family protein [Muribaculaceae bacterium]MCM1479851.1 SMI1/KNR4 family protein [Muribaculaceae bacterium]